MIMTRSGYNDDERQRTTRNDDEVILSRTSDGKWACQVGKLILSTYSISLTTIYIHRPYSTHGDRDNGALDNNVDE